MSQVRGNTATQPRSSKGTTTKAAEKVAKVATMTIRLDRELHTRMTTMVGTSGQSANEWVIDAIERKMVSEMENGWGDDVIAMVKEMQKSLTGD